MQSFAEEHLAVALPHAQQSYGHAHVELGVSTALHINRHAHAKHEHAALHSNKRYVTGHRPAYSCTSVKPCVVPIPSISPV